MSRYEAKRNKLIPLAVKFANKKIPANIPAKPTKKGRAQEAWTLDTAAKWSGVFHDEMNRLWAAHG